MKKIFAVSIISGNHDFLKRRCLQEFVGEATTRGWQIQTLSGEQEQDIYELLSSSILFSSPSLLVIHDPEKIKNPDILIEHGKEKQPDTRAVLFCSGKVKGSAGKIAKAFPKSHAVLDVPPFFQEHEFAVNFIQHEAENYGKKLPEKTANVIVYRSGTELGLLSFEIRKICLLADARGDQEITHAHLSGLLANLGEVSVFPLLNAIGYRDLKTTVRELGKIKRNEAQDPTIRISRFLASTVYQWLGAASLLSQAVKPDDAAQQLGVNPYYFKKSILPVAESWRVRDLITLLEIFTESERMQRKGALLPWTFFTGKLIQLLSGKSGGT